MANLLSPSTPPPSTIHTPNTPQFGFYDDYQPYSPRRSSRLAQRHQRLRRTAAPSYLLSDKFHNSHSSSTLATKFPSENMTTYSNPQAVPKLQVPTDLRTEKNRKKTLAQPSYSSVKKEVQNIDISNRVIDVDTDHIPKSTIRKTGMLPTPSKTPKKRPEKASKSITSVARKLFPVQSDTVYESSLVSDKKGDKMASSKFSDKTSKIGKPRAMEIFTDSHDRIPEIDSCPNNPFCTNFKSKQHEPTRRTSKRRKIMVPGEGLKSIEDIEGRNDGLLYVFRGKKVWKKFSENPEVSMNAQEESSNNTVLVNDFLDPSLNRPLTRSSMKPRLLFPQTRKRRIQELESHSTEDEEAETDIEEHAVLTSKAFNETRSSTPKRSRPTPVSPPTTLRVTRSKQFDLERFPRTSTAHSEFWKTCSKSLNSYEPGTRSPSDLCQNLKLRAGEASGDFCEP